MQSESKLGCFPVEVWEAILAQTLDQNTSVDLDLQNLMILQTVCVAFVEPTRRLMYRHVELSKPSQVLLLLDTLSSRPDYCQYIQSLRIRKWAVSRPEEHPIVTMEEINRLVSMASNLKILDSYWIVTFQSFPQQLTHWRFSSIRYDRNHTYTYTQPNPLPQILTAPATLQHMSIRESMDTSLLVDLPDQPVPPHLVLSSLRLSNISRMNPLFLRWLLKPSLAADSITRLTLWNVDGDDGHLFSILTSFSRLEEIRYSSTNPYSAFNTPAGTLARRIVETCKCLKVIMFGPWVAEHSLYEYIASPDVTDICISVSRPGPSNQGISMAGFRNLLNKTHGRLSKLVRLRLYSGIFYELPISVMYAPVESEFALREVAFSSVRFLPGELVSFLDMVGPGLRSLSLHRIFLATSQILRPCPNLFRLELGAAIEQDSASTIINQFDLRKVEFLRIHLSSGTTLEDVLDLLNPSRGLVPRLQVLDLTGEFPVNVSGDWKSAALVKSLWRVSRQRNLQLWFNEIGQHDVGDFWRACLVVRDTHRITFT